MLNQKPSKVTPAVTFAKCRVRIPSRTWIAVEGFSQSFQMKAVEYLEVDDGLNVFY